MAGALMKRWNLDTKAHTEGTWCEHIGRRRSSTGPGERPGTDPSLIAPRRHQACDTLILDTAARFAVVQATQFVVHCYGSPSKPIHYHKNYHKFSSLKQHIFVLSHFCRRLVMNLTRVKSRYQQGCNAFWSLYGRICFLAHSGCQQYSVPCGCRIKVPISLLSAEGCSQLLEADCMPLPMTPLPQLQDQQWQVESFSWLDSLLPLLPLPAFLPSSFTFKGPCNFTEPTQDNLE